MEQEKLNRGLELSLVRTKMYQLSSNVFVLSSGYVLYL